MQSQHTNKMGGVTRHKRTIAMAANKLIPFQLNGRNH
jgi:hypothetical protein